MEETCIGHEPFLQRMHDGAGQLAFRHFALIFSDDGHLGIVVLLVL